MRGLLAASTFLALAACGQPPTEPAPPAQGAAASPVEGSTTPIEAKVAVPGWETDAAAYIGMGTTVPPFSGASADGTAFSHESLRGRWTILGFDAFDTSSEDEKIFIAALNSAADQDPELDFLQVFKMPPDVTAPPVTKWPSIADNGAAAEAFGLASTPAYLLIGPDLTIEGYRGGLSATPEDGVKPVFRGVHEIRKQIAAPH